MEQEGEYMDEKYLNKDKVSDKIGGDGVGFRDDFAQELAWNAGQYHEEENYLDIDLSGEIDSD
jgi:hypothetical protein